MNTELIEIAFIMGAEWGKRYERLYMQAGLDNAMNITQDDISAAAHGGMGLSKSKKGKELQYKAIAFQNSRKEIVEELEKHNTVGKEDLLKLLKKLCKKENGQMECS
jgi:hypothetical protein